MCALGFTAFIVFVFIFVQWFLFVLNVKRKEMQVMQFTYSNVFLQIRREDRAAAAVPFC